MRLKSFKHIGQAAIRKPFDATNRFYRRMLTKVSDKMISAVSKESKFATFSQNVVNRMGIKNSFRIAKLASKFDIFFEALEMFSSIAILRQVNYLRYVFNMLTGGCLCDAITCAAPPPWEAHMSRGSLQPLQLVSLEALIHKAILAAVAVPIYLLSAFMCLALDVFQHIFLMVLVSKLGKTERDAKIRHQIEKFVSLSLAEIVIDSLNPLAHIPFATTFLRPVFMLSEWKQLQMIKKMEQLYFASEEAQPEAAASGRLRLFYENVKLVLKVPFVLLSESKLFFTPKPAADSKNNKLIPRIGYVAYRFLLTVFLPAIILVYLLGVNYIVKRSSDPAMYTVDFDFDGKYPLRPEEQKLFFNPDFSVVDLPDSLGTKWVKSRGRSVGSGSAKDIVWTVTALDSSRNPDKYSISWNRLADGLGISRDYPLGDVYFLSNGPLTMLIRREGSRFSYFIPFEPGTTKFSAYSQIAFDGRDKYIIISPLRDAGTEPDSVQAEKRLN